MAKTADAPGKVGQFDGILKDLAGHKDRLSKMLETETDSNKRNGIVNARSMIKEAITKLTSVTI